MKHDEIVNVGLGLIEKSIFFDQSYWKNPLKAFLWQTKDGLICKNFLLPKIVAITNIIFTKQL